VKRPLVLVSAIAAALILAALWATVTWVPTAGALLLWSAATGTLRVPDRGLTSAPRWSGERYRSQGLAEELQARTADGVDVKVTVVLDPPVGVWQLEPAATPGEGMRGSVSATVENFIAAMPLACLAEFTTRPPECQVDPSAQLSGNLANGLGLPVAAFAVSLEPDREALRERLLAEVAGGLSIPNHKVLVLGLDGLDWDLVLPWVRSGRMPNLRRLMDAGTWGEMQTIVPMLSPLIWTTMATGVSADVHGVLDFVEKDPATGQQVPVTGRGRRVPAIWNIASALGLDVDVVGWWATWPAERISGTMISDRLYYTLQQAVPREVFHEDPPDLVFPPERTAEFTAIRDRAVIESDWRAVRYFMNVSESDFDRAVADNRGMEDPIDGMRRILAASRTYLGAGLVLAGEKPDLLMVYLEGTDTIGHLLAPYMPPPTIETDPAAAPVYAAAVPRYFEVVDRWIGRYLDVCSLDEYAVILVSDHGFKWDHERPRGLSGMAGPTAALWHAEDAVFVIAGAGVARGGRVEVRPSVADVAPTIATLLGIRIDSAWSTTLLPGSPPPVEPVVEWAPLVPPLTYRQGGGGAAPTDPEFLAKLEALGYIGVDGTSAGAAAATTPKVGESAVTPGSINNLALLKINEKKYDEAEQLLRRAIAMSPGYASPHFNLRRIYMETERWEKADEELWIAIDKGLRDPERTLDQAAADYEGLGLPERAEALAAVAAGRFPGHEPFYVRLMMLRIRAGRCAEAMPAGAAAAERFPDSGPVHAFYGLAAACVGESAIARRELERALEIDPDQPMLRQALQQVVD
jgi:Flp pilus assembly protein TadD